MPAKENMKTLDMNVRHNAMNQQRRFSDGYQQDAHARLSQIVVSFASVRKSNERYMTADDRR